jgi:tetratricopeptide (TPR) repeat protein/tRNA A-37 threonylcarbamoyl transferase component Bud32
MQCPECGAENADEARTCRACQFDLSEAGLTIERAAVAATDLSGAAHSPPRSTPSPRRSPSGASLTDDTDLNARYHIVRQLGEGGMGEVYLADDRELDREVALKLIRTDLTKHPAIMERFRREIQLATRITHKNVLRVYDLGEANGLKFLSMQYVDGEDLSAVLRREGRLPLPRVIELFRQICEGLAAAHEQGVIHRDLKPQNIMIDGHGRVLITDFGLAKSLEQVSLTEAGKIIGTPHYMSPEQVKGVPLDQRSDIYSLGIMLYEMLTGIVPFSGGSAYEVMIQRIQKTPRPASDHNPKIPPYLLKILHRCLEQDPNLRYGSTDEILRDLDTQTFHSNFGARLLHDRRWIRSAAVVGAVLVVLIAAALIGRYATGQGGETGGAPHRPVSVLVADLENRTGDAVFDGTLEPILTVAMEGASFITSYNRGQAHRVATQIQPQATNLDERLARLVAVREGLNVVISGAISRGDSYHLALRAIDGVTGKAIENSEVMAKSKEEVLSAVGRAAADLRKALGDTTPVSTQLAAAETFTAGSLEAAHEYALGQDLLYRGKFDDAARHYEQAIKLDPNLGRAYAGLAIDYANMGRKGDAEAYYKLAMSHIDRMTDREKYRTRAGYYLMTRNNARAIEELTQLVKQYPADMAGLNNLPIAYFYSRDMSRALEESQRAITLYPKNYVARNNAALYAMYAGDFGTAAKQAQTVLAMNPAYLKAYVAIALSQLGQNDIAAATETYKRLASQGASGQSSAAIGLADVALYEGRAGDAVRILKEGIDRDRAEKRTDSANRKLATLAAALLLAGDKRGAIAAADEAAKNASTSHDEHALYTAAHALLEAGEEKLALSIASQLEAQIEPELQLYGKLIQGEALLRRAKPRDALVRFEEAKRLGDAWLARFDRGRAYLELGAFTEADTDFETCTKRRGEATAVFLDDVPTFHYFPPVYYYLGRAQEGLGSANAADSYKQFLAIKAKSSGDPLVADARKRVTGK